MIKAIWLRLTSNVSNRDKVKIRQETDQMLKRRQAQKELQDAEEANPSR
jgi:hypothetical protein